MINWIIIQSVPQTLHHEQFEQENKGRSDGEICRLTLREKLKLNKPVSLRVTEHFLHITYGPINVTANHC